MKSKQYKKLNIKMKIWFFAFILLSGCDLFSPKSKHDKMFEKEDQKIMEEFKKGNVRPEVLFDTLLKVRYDLMIKSNPKDTSSYGLRAFHKTRIGDYKGAILDYDKVIELNPNDYIVYQNRGDAKSEIEDYEGAISDYNKVLEYFPARDAYLGRGNAKYKLGDIKNACLDWRKVEMSEYSDCPDNNYEEARKMIIKHCK